MAGRARSRAGSLMRRVVHLVPVDEVGRNRRRARARAIMCLASAAMLLVLELAWAVAARAQANIMLSGAGLTGSIASNTNWSLAKNGGAPTRTPERDGGGGES